jgi:hypothetical protein
VVGKEVHEARDFAKCSLIVKKEEEENRSALLKCYLEPLEMFHCFESVFIFIFG